MKARQRGLALFNLLIGPAVLISYVLSARAHSSQEVAKLWGDVPEAVRPYYTAWMFVAATGYFLFTYFLLFRVDADRVRVAKRWGFGLFHVLYAMILIPSAIWMPLTLHHIVSPTPLTWKLVVLGLWTSGLASLGLIAALVALEPRAPERPWRLAVIGSVLFAGQTWVLDSCVWVLLFHV